ncbi:hypothetical protein [Nocardia sp. NPDC058705]|uniref:hypothetical protein n=1 Tax=Nocardia sp. NPDC058705 TaxID=3346609 RepID=UPI003684C8B1
MAVVEGTAAGAVDPPPGVVALLLVSGIEVAQPPAIRAAATQANMHRSRMTAPLLIGGCLGTFVLPRIAE